jgi:predicted component of type VI protein secretion system
VTRESLTSIVQDGKAPLDAIAYGTLAPTSSSGLASLSSASHGRFALATTAAGLSEALRNDLGTKPVPAFDVKFGYGAKDATSKATAALEYEAPGRPVMVIPINDPVAAPALAAPPVVASQAAASDASAASVATPASQPVKTGDEPGSRPVRPESWLDRSFTIANVTITAKGLLAGLVALLAGLALIVAWWRRQRPEPAPAPAPLPAVEPSPRRGADHPATRVSAVFATPSAGRPTAYLVSSGSRGTVTRHPIETKTFRIGADTHNDLVVTGDAFVSRKHASIRFEGGTLYLTDLGSSNGTFRNELRLTETAVSLAPGDVLRFGRTSYELESADRVRMHAASGQPDTHHEPKVP